ncbi:MAG: small multi-drug export protein [Oscillospiraceae bacterium]|jgi:uncharacterized membrane protein|nr:small multi-drug export protein [Oscillospiraceae bacterium]
MEELLEPFVSSPDIVKALITFLLSCLPIVELRVAIPAGALLGLPVLTSAAVSVFGNILPVPFIILFMRRILAWMRKRSALLERAAIRLELKARSKSDMLYRSEIVGLLIFVAIPLPGTGAWSGALIAAVLGIRVKAAFPAITAGVIIAGIAVTGITYGFRSLLSA